ncbi:MAG: hypothetical protein IJ844_01010, partial [Prevotella sp.]|nr:hypothetical protein [Prevotella sp.]
EETSTKICLSVLLSRRNQQEKYVLLSFCQNDISKEKYVLSVLLSKRHQQEKYVFLSFCQNDISKEKCLSVLLSNALRPSV